MEFRLGELAERLGGEVRGDAERRIAGVATLTAAGPRDLSFLTNPRYREEAAQSRAGALLVARGHEIAGHDLLVAGNPYLGLARLLALFFPSAPLAPGTHPSAVVGERCRIDPEARVGPCAVIGDDTEVAAGAAIGALAAVGRECRIGRDSVLYPHVVLYDRTQVGERCILHSGVVLGSDGFGYAQHEGRHVKIPQVGSVVVEDDVEIGANTTIDRAMLEETRIGAGSKIDNLVQVGHNVRIGRGCLLISHVAISGSTELGDGVILAGQSGVAGHLHLGDGARVAAKSAVFKDVAAGEQVGGIPAVPAGKWRRQQALVGRLQEMQRRLAAVEAALAAGAPERKETGE